MSPDELALDRRKQRTARWLGLRVSQLLVVVAIVLVLTALAVHVVPGDPARSILGSRAGADSVAALREELGLDEPVAKQVGGYLSEVVRGDLGDSLVQRRSVGAIISEALPVTLALIGVSTVFSLLVGIPIGLGAATTKRAKVSRAVDIATIILLALPPFFLGLVLLLVVALDAGLAPAGGWATSWPENLEYLWLPALALAGFMLPLVVRTVRQSAQDILPQDFIEAAIARGLRPRTVRTWHVLPNSLLPLIALVGFNAAALLSGAVVVETVFGLPGLGSQLFTAVQARDYPVIQGIALVTAIVVVLINLLTDVLSETVDPRARRG